MWAEDLAEQQIGKGFSCVDSRGGSGPADAPPAYFADQSVYEKPSAYIRSLIDG